MLTVVKDPSGGGRLLNSLPPQQTTEPSSLTAQLWVKPAVTETKGPPFGGIACPWLLPWVSL